VGWHRFPRPQPFSALTNGLGCWLQRSTTPLGLTLAVSGTSKFLPRINADFRCLVDVPSAFGFIRMGGDQGLRRGGPGGMELSNHPYRKRTAACEDLGRSAFAANQGGFWRKPFWSMWNLMASSGSGGKMAVLILIGRDQNGQNFAFVVLRRAGLRIPERFDPHEGGVVVGFGADRSWGELLELRDLIPREREASVLPDYGDATAADGCAIK
jgi:hypothetical protein